MQIYNCLKKSHTNNNSIYDSLNIFIIRRSTPLLFDGIFHAKGNLLPYTKMMLTVFSMEGVQEMSLHLDNIFATKVVA